METGCIGFLLGALVAIVFCGIGVCFGRLDKSESADDRDIRIYSPSSDRQHRSVDRYTHTAEEMIQVLQMMRFGVCRYERDILNEVIDLIEKGNEDANK